MRTPLTLALIALAAAAFVAAMVCLGRASDLAALYWLTLGAFSLATANRAAPPSTQGARWK